jgi:hypothetical protein
MATLGRQFSQATAESGPLDHFQPGQSISVALCAVTDYGRLACGEDIVKEMSEWVLARKGKPLQPDL